MPIKKYLLTGLLVWLPTAITFAVLLWLMDLLDGIFVGVMTVLQAIMYGGIGFLLGLIVMQVLVRVRLF